MTGHASVFDKVTHEDKTQELLKSVWVKDILAAQSRGRRQSRRVGKALHAIYGPLSMQAHGLTYGFRLKSKVDEEMVAILALANVLMESINLVVKNWIVSRKLTTVSAINAVLNARAD
jgi:hypothetical protein